MPNAGTLILDVVPNTAAVGAKLEAQMIGAGSGAGKSAGAAIEKEIIGAGTTAGKSFMGKLDNVLMQGVRMLPGGAQLESALTKLLPNAGVWAAAAAATAAVVWVSVKAFNEEKFAVDQLNLAIKASPALLGASIDGFREFASVQSELTGYQDHAVLSAMSQLAAFDLTQQQIQGLLPLVEDYARATDTDLVTASKNVGLALLGNTRALKAVGIEFKATGDRGADTAKIMDALKEKVGGTSAAFLETHPIEAFKDMLNDAGVEIGEDVLPALTTLGNVAIDFARVAIPIVTGAIHVAVVAMEPLIWGLKKVDERFDAISDTAAANADATSGDLRTIAQGLTLLAVNGGEASDEMQGIIDFALAMKSIDPAVYTQLLAAAESDLANQFTQGHLSGEEYTGMLERLGVSAPDAASKLDALKSQIAATAAQSDIGAFSLSAMADAASSLTAEQVAAAGARLKDELASVGYAQGVSTMISAIRGAEDAEKALSAASVDVRKTQGDLVAARQKAALVSDLLAAAEKRLAASEDATTRASDQLAPRLSHLASEAGDLTKATLAAADAELELYNAELQAAGGVTAVVGAQQQAIADKRALAAAELAVETSYQEAYNQALEDGGTAQEAAAAGTAAHAQALIDLKAAQLSATDSAMSVASAVLSWQKQIADGDISMKEAIAGFEVYARKAGLTAGEIASIVATFQHQVVSSSKTTMNLSPDAQAQASQDVIQGHIDALTAREKTANQAVVDALKAHEDALKTWRDAGIKATDSQMTLTKATLDWEKALIDGRETTDGAIGKFQEFADAAGIARAEQKKVIDVLKRETDQADLLAASLGNINGLQGNMGGSVGGSVGAGSGTSGPAPHRFASGAIVKARPGGTLITGLFAEAGRDEAIVPLPAASSAGQFNGPVQFVITDMDPMRGYIVDVAAGQAAAQSTSDGLVGSMR